MIPLYFVAAACVSVVFNIWAESVDTGRPPKETARALIEATSNWVATKSRATVDYVGRLQLGRHIRFPRVRSNLIATVPHDFVLVDYRSPRALRRSSRAVAQPGFCTIDFLKPRTLKLPAVPSQLNSVVLCEPRHASAIAHSSLSPSAHVYGDFNAYTGTFTLVLVIVIPLVAIAVIVFVVAFWRTQRVSKAHRQLPPPTEFIEDAAPQQLVLGFADAVDTLLLLTDSTLELALGDINVNSILSDELVPPLEELDPGAKDLCGAVSGPDDVVQDVVDDDSKSGLLSSVTFECEESVASLVYADIVECAIDDGSAVPEVLEEVCVATPDISTSSAVTEAPALLDAVNVPLPADDSDDFLAYIDLVTDQDTLLNAVSAEVFVPIITTSESQVAARSSCIADATLAQSTLDFADAFNILFQLDHSSVETTAGDVEVVGILPNEPVAAISEAAVPIPGPEDAVKDIPDVPNYTFIDPATFDPQQWTPASHKKPRGNQSVPAPQSSPVALPPPVVTMENSTFALEEVDNMTFAAIAQQLPFAALELPVTFANPVADAADNDFLDYVDAAVFYATPVKPLYSAVLGRPPATTSERRTAVHPQRGITYAAGQEVQFVLRPRDHLAPVFSRPVVNVALPELDGPWRLFNKSDRGWRANPQDPDNPHHPVSKQEDETKKGEEVVTPKRDHINSWKVDRFPVPGRYFLRWSDVNDPHPTIPPSLPRPPHLVPCGPADATPPKKPRTRRGGVAYRAKQEAAKEAAVAAEVQLAAQAAEQAEEIARYATAIVIGHADHRVSERYRLPLEPLPDYVPQPGPHWARIVDLIVSRRGSPLVAPEDLIPPPPYHRPFNIPPSPNFGARRTRPHDEGDNDKNYDDEFPPFPPDAPSGGAAISSAVASTSTPWSATVSPSESLAQVAALWTDVDRWDTDPDMPTSSTPQAPSSSSSAPASVSTLPEAPSSSWIPRPSLSSHTPGQQQTSRTSSATHQQAVSQTQSPSSSPSTSHIGYGQHLPSSNMGPSRSRVSSSFPSATMHAPNPGPSSSSQIPRPDPTSTSSTTTRPDSSSRPRSRPQSPSTPQPPCSASSSSTTNATTQNASQTTTGASMTTIRPQASSSTCPPSSSTASTTTRHPSTSSAPRRRRPQEAHGASPTTTSIRPSTLP